MKEALHTVGKRSFAYCGKKKLCTLWEKEALHTVGKSFPHQQIQP